MGLIGRKNAIIGFTGRILFYIYRMKKLFLFIGIIAFFVSCNNSSGEKVTASNNVAKDTLSVLFKEAYFPLVADTTLLFKIETFDSLKSPVIKVLSQHMADDKATTDVLFNLKDFFRIDSVKSDGKYQQYCDSLEIGMTKNVMAYAIYKVKLDSNTVLLAWGLHSMSYEACPNLVSSTLYYTVMHKGQITETFCSGSAVWFADPPSMARTITTSRLLQDGSFTTDFTNVVGDSDSLTAEISHETRNYLLKDGHIKFVSEKADPLIHTKHSSLF